MDLSIYEKPVKIDLIGGVLFVNGSQHPSESRTLRQMGPTLMGEVEGERDVYRMYRNVYRENDIRYDITVIPAKPMGDECARTHGHYHPKSPEGLEYPEIYQVMSGSALFILQKGNRDGSVDVMIVDAEKGDTILIPPGYGHTTVNRGEETLVLANLVFDKFASLYEDFKRDKGPAYYYTTGHELVQNTNYFVHKNERMGAKELNKRYGVEAKDLLTEFFGDPHRFAFLEKPKML